MLACAKARLSAGPGRPISDPADTDDFRPHYRSEVVAPSHLFLLLNLNCIHSHRIKSWPYCPSHSSTIEDRKDLDEDYQDWTITMLCR
jgi:hypothetical protein